MPGSGSPLTPTRRKATVISIISSPSPQVEIQVGADTSETQFVPFLDSYAPHVGDNVVAIENQGDYVVVGSVNAAPFVWQALGPASLTDFGTGGGTVVSLAVPVIAGRSYRVGAYIIGLMVTNAGLVTVKILAGGADIGPTGSSVRPMNINVAVGIAGCGYAAYRYAATSTTSVTFSVTAVCSAGALRTQINNCQLTVNDDGIT